MISLGIDIGFTNKSLASSPYARCAPLRREVVSLYIPPQQGKPDELQPYRDVHRFLPLHRLKGEEPSLYRRAVEEMGLLPFQQEVPWPDEWAERLPPDLRSSLEAYVEARPSPWVKLERLPEDMRGGLLAKIGEEDRASAWDALPWREREERYCRGCPIRPLGEPTCSLRFSSYPGMNSFREGFLLALLYASAIDQEGLKGAWGAFPHLDRSKGELPRHKLQELYQMVKGVEANKAPEESFNLLVDMLEKVAPSGAKLDAQKVNLRHLPFVDNFVSAFIYRSDPYTPQEARRWLPYLETLLEVGEAAIWDADNPRMRHRLLAFRGMLHTLVTALQTVDKYEVEAYMSF